MKTLKTIALLAGLLTATSSYAAQTITYYHWDALGSPVVATDEQGNVKWREEYKPYGEKIQNQPQSASNTRWYTGHPHDNATGLTYMGARWYDPVVGRFMGVDPVAFTEKNLHSFNQYNYANNNPYRYIDPDGNSPVWYDPSDPMFDDPRVSKEAIDGQFTGMVDTYVDIYKGVAIGSTALLGGAGAAPTATSLAVRAIPFATEASAKAGTALIAGRVAYDNGVSRITTAVGNAADKVVRFGNNLLSWARANPEKPLDYVTNALEPGPSPITSWWGLGGAATGQVLEPHEYLR